MHQASDGERGAERERGIKREMMLGVSAGALVCSQCPAGAYSSAAAGPWPHTHTVLVLRIINGKQERGKEERAKRRRRRGRGIQEVDMGWGRVSVRGMETVQLERQRQREYRLKAQKGWILQSA